VLIFSNRPSKDVTATAPPLHEEDKRLAEGLANFDWDSEGSHVDLEGTPAASRGAGASAESPRSGANRAVLLYALAWSLFPPP
jgi:hypothetical protein